MAWWILKSRGALVVFDTSSQAYCFQNAGVVRHHAAFKNYLIAVLNLILVGDFFLSNFVYNLNLYISSRLCLYFSLLL
jgi:hypothetical protein